MTFVSVIVPCYNEARTITALLDAVYLQTWPRDQMEVIIADGLSEDGTREAIAAWQQKHADLSVRVVDNPARIIPAGLNVALDVARGDVIVRLDAHSMPRPDYIARCVDLLSQGCGDNVGGRWEIRPGADSAVARGIAAAAGHPLGVGDAKYRHSEQAAAVDTVPFGAFRRSLLDKVGRFDESLLTNEDYEFNARVRLSGGRVWFDPAIRATYVARPDWLSLARQYWRYGYWKWRMLRRYPATLRWRQALPPLFVLGVAGGPFLWWISFLRRAYWLALAFYLLVLLSAGAARAWRQRDWTLVWTLPVSIAVMHFAWGAGFLWSLLSSPAVKKESANG